MVVIRVLRNMDGLVMRAWSHQTSWLIWPILCLILVTPALAAFPTGFIEGYKLDNNLSVNTSTHDLTPGGTSPSFMTGKFGDGVNLTLANTESLNENSDLDLGNGAKSISAWFSADSLPSSDQSHCFLFTSGVRSIFTLADDPTETMFGVCLIRVGGVQKIAITRIRQMIAFDTATFTGVGVGEWHHIVAIYDGSTQAKLYLDGVNVVNVSSTGNGASGVLSDRFVIGASAGASDDTGAFFDGMIDSVYLYDYVLSQSEISALYNAVGEWDAVGSPVVTVTYPLNNSHERFDNNDEFWFNYTLTTITPANCTFNINWTDSWGGTGYLDTLTNYSISSGNHSFEYSPLGTNDIIWSITCTNVAGTTFTGNYTGVLDPQIPICTPYAPSFYDHFNSTTQNVLFNATGVWNTVCSDAYIFLTNMTIQNSTTILWQDYRYNLTSSEENITNTTNFSAYPTGTYYVVEYVEDDHTAATIPAYGVGKDLATGELLFDTDKGTHLTVKLKSATANLTGIDTEKLIDRYTFSYYFDGYVGTLQTYVFKLSSSEPIYYRGSLYPSPSFVSGKHWIDFKLDTEHPVAYDKVKYVPQSNSWELTIISAEKHLRFNSVGGLNILNKNYTFNVVWIPHQAENLTLTDRGDDYITFSWETPAHASGVTLYRDGEAVLNTSSEEYNDTSLLFGTGYSYVLLAYYNESGTLRYNLTESSENTATFTTTGSPELDCLYTTNPETGGDTTMRCTLSGTVNRTINCYGVTKNPVDESVLDINPRRDNTFFTASSQGFRAVPTRSSTQYVTVVFSNKRVKSDTLTTYEARCVSDDGTIWSYAVNLTPGQHEGKEVVEAWIGLGSNASYILGALFLIIIFVVLFGLAWKAGT